MSGWTFDSLGQDRSALLDRTLLTDEHVQRILDVEARVESMLPEQREVVPFLVKATVEASNGGSPVLLLAGGPGAGKSFVLGWFKDWCVAWGKVVMLTASTASAGRLIDGVTVHSALGLGPLCDNRVKYESAADTVIRSWSRPGGNRFSVNGRMINVIAIDEISMVDDKIYTVIDRIHRDFGTGVVLLLCGDFKQLPPASESGIYCFMSEAWNQRPPTALVLRCNFRQLSDTRHQMIINAVGSGVVTRYLARVRSGKICQPTPEMYDDAVRRCNDELPHPGASMLERDDWLALRSLGLLRTRYFNRDSIPAHPSGVEPSLLFPQVEQARLHNEKKLSAIRQPVIGLLSWIYMEQIVDSKYRGRRAVTLPFGSKAYEYLEPPWSETSLSQLLHNNQSKFERAFRCGSIKKGAQVRCTYNMNTSIINGLKGVVVGSSMVRFKHNGIKSMDTSGEDGDDELDEDQVLPRPGKRGQYYWVECPVISWRAVDGSSMDPEVMLPHRWGFDLSPKHGETLRVFVVGFPLCLSWATTIHDVQGQTMGPVAIDFGESLFSVPGMAYVVFSRVRELEDLFVLGMRNSALEMNQAAMEFDRSLVTGERAVFRRESLLTTTVAGRKRIRGGGSGGGGGSGSGGESMVVIDGVSLFAIASASVTRERFLDAVANIKQPIVRVVTLGGAYYKSQEWLRSWADVRDIPVIEVNVDWDEKDRRRAFEKRDKEVADLANRYLFVDADGELLKRDRRSDGGSGGARIRFIHSNICGFRGDRDIIVAT